MIEGSISDISSHESHPMETLSQEQTDFYYGQGYLVLERVIPEMIVSEIRSEFSRLAASGSGAASAQAAMLSRPLPCPHGDIPSAHLKSEVIQRLLRSDLVLGPVRDLIGPAVRLQGARLATQPDNDESEGWHQDWAYSPCTNDDVLAVTLILDDVSAGNAPLSVYPGSHRGAVLDHHANGYFSGRIEIAEADLGETEALALSGPAGSIILRHTRLVHRSRGTGGMPPARMLTVELAAADAFPIFGACDPSQSLEEFDGRLLCGGPTVTPRIEPVEIRIPYPLPPPERHGAGLHSGYPPPYPSPSRPAGARQMAGE